MRARVVRPFRYALDKEGLRLIDLVVGDEMEFRADLAPGLLQEGFIRAVETEPVVEQASEPAHRGASRKRGR